MTLQHGTIKNNETGQTLTGTHEREATDDNPRSTFTFRPDGARISNLLAQGDWTFTADPPPPPNYPILSVVSGGSLVPAVKTRKGWEYVGHGGPTGLVHTDADIIARVSRYPGDVRVFLSGTDITETGA